MKRKRTLVGLSIVLCLIIVEAIGFGVAAYLDLWSSWGERDAQLGWIFYPEHEPNRWYDVKPAEEARSEARRDAGLSPEILFLGDSVTRAGSLPEELVNESFAGALGGFNAGMDGYSTYQERDLFIRDLASLRAKRVVLVICLNDIMSEAENQDAIRVTLKENFHIGQRTVLDYEPYYRIFRWLRARAAYRAWINVDLDTKRKSFTRVTRLELDGARPVEPAVWAEWTKSILQIREAVQPGQFLVVLAPVRSHMRSYMDGRRDYWVNRELARFSNKQGIPFLDLLPVFAGAGVSELKAFEDAFHFTIVGHRIAAPAIRAFLDSHPPGDARPASPHR
ncbi:MAG: SGNH/GDSL hydrolase family protein [Elusimicrobiota bacterium]